MSLKMLLIDNYDSFTYNLVQYFGELGADLQIFRNDKITIREIEALQPEKIVISPGPCSPNEAGISCQVIEYFCDQLPLLGVCLGHQCISQVFGGQIVRADKLMHGKTSMIQHKNQGIFTNLPNPFEATRYHSLILNPLSKPDCLTITAWTEDNEIMGIQHTDLPVFGVQFHPESILTKEGKKLLSNFLNFPD